MGYAVAVANHPVTNGIATMAASPPVPHSVPVSLAGAKDAITKALGSGEADCKQGCRRRHAKREAKSGVLHFDLLRITQAAWMLLELTAQCIKHIQQTE